MLNLNDDQRQNLTTWSMLGGAMAFTILTAVMVYIIRWSWPKEVMVALAPVILDKLAWIAFGTLGLVGVMVVAMATIAVGGRLRGKAGMFEIEAETENAVPVAKVTTETVVSAEPGAPV